MRIDPSTTPGLGQPGPQARARALEAAVRDFETELLSSLVKSMWQTTLADPEEEPSPWLELGHYALARALATAPDGPHLATSLLERLRSLDAPGALPALPSAAASPAPSRPARVTPAGHPDARRHPRAAPPPQPAEPSPPSPPEVRSRFGPRIDPISGKRAFHRGVDLKASRGTPIGAAHAGQVIVATESPGFGRHVVVRHRDARDTVYAHLDSLAVRPGDRVETGQVLGHAGSTGRATGPHLHFEVREAGRPVDPRRLLGAEPGWVTPVLHRQEAGIDELG